MNIVKKERNLNGVKLRKNNRGALDETLLSGGNSEFSYFPLLFFLSFFF